MLQFTMLFQNIQINVLISTIVKSFNILTNDLEKYIFLTTHDCALVLLLIS